MIKIVTVKDRAEGNLKAHDILKEIVDLKTLLALSGGTSPDYQSMITGPGDVIPGAICVVDERYEKSFHADSNELLLESAGLFDFAKDNSIEVVKILSGKPILETEKDYDRVIDELFAKFPKRVGVMGIGTNLHTAGIFPYSAAARAPDFVVSEEVEDQFPLRISLTMRALGEFQNFVILVFGKEKRKALEILLDKGENDMQKYPAIFYRMVPIKSFLITDIDLQ